MKKLIILFLIILTAVYIWLSSSSAQKPVCPDCNLVIVAYDALQASHVSHLGYKNETTPMIDTLAREGVSFRQAISASSWTVPTFMSVFTGLYPSEHKVVNKYTIYSPEEKVITNLKKLSPNVETLAEVLKANGYKTGGFTGDAGVHSQFGYNQGFDAYTDEQTFGSMTNSADHALKWLQENKGKKFFMFLHGYDSHGQFKLPEGYQGRFMPANYSGKYKGTISEQSALREEGLAKGKLELSPSEVEFWRGWYDSKIRDADDRFAVFWDKFTQMGLDKKTIVVVLSDHGTEFYEHQRFDHGHSLYDELVRVPLIFVAPHIAKNKLIDQQVTSIDVAPTVLEMLGIKPSGQYARQQRGKSLVSFLTGMGGNGRDIFMETDYRNYTFKRGIRTTDGWKLIISMEDGKKELYNLKEDPEELINLVEKEGKIAYELEQRVYRHIKDTGGTGNSWNVGCLPVYADQCR